MVVKKKSLIFAIIFLSLLIPLSTAALEVEKTAKSEVVIPELNNPAIFDFNIKNLGQQDSFEIFSLVGVTMDPRGAFELTTGDNPIEVKAYLSEDIRNKMLSDNINFSYSYTKSQDDAKLIARRAVAEGYNVVVACGGDGTVMEVINGIYGTKAKLGILPLGTSNDFAKRA